MNLLHNPRFVFTWLSGMTLTLGFSIFFLSVSWLTIDVLQQPALLGIILTAVSLPRVVMMVFGGVFADRFQKSRLLFLTNLGQAALMLAVLSLHLLDLYSVAALIGISVIFGILDGMSYPALSSLIPSLVKQHELQRANSLFQGSLELMFVIGPFLAGLLLTWGGFGLSFGTAAGLIFLAALLIMPRLIQDRIPAAHVMSLAHVIVDLKEGIRYVSHTPILRSGTLSIAIVNLFVMGPLIMSIPILVGERGGTAFDLSVIEGGLAVGTFVASFLVLLMRSVHRGRFVFRALLLTIAAFLLYTQAQSIPMLALTAALSGFMLMLVYLPAVTLMQEHSDQDKIGRVMSIMALAASGLEPVAFAVLSVLVALAVPIQTLLITFGIIGLALSGLLFVRSQTFRHTR
ncbi:MULTISPECIES: MFS transporter [Exiguobacterium]|uniref:Enterobactin exporter EntS n=1 Tax=Exiguobacterium aurantiacum TaxID=33987 RepID=A0A377FY67_9BACL|nr:MULTISPECIES: MFS transporter [Exiguobacterium]STO09253.1 enterobactin exporter EntS [Exiguobacterium aurantiacum]